MLLNPSPCHKLSHLLGPPPPSSVTYFMDGPLLQFRTEAKSYSDHEKYKDTGVASALRRQIVDDGGGAPTIKNRSDGRNLSAAVRQAQSSILMIK